MAFFPETPLLPDAPEASKLSQLYGFVPQMFRLQGGIPHVVGPQANLLEALLADETHLSRAQKERILLASSAARRSSYGVALHEEMLKLHGVSESEIGRIVAGGLPDGADGALIAVAKKLILKPMEFQAEDVEELRRAGFIEPQILEAVLLVGYSDLFTTLEFGTGAEPDFTARAIPEWTEEILHPQPAESRLPDAEIGDDPDAAEVSRAQSGDLAAFEILVERHTQRIYRTLIGLLGNPEDAKDALQDTFLKAFQNLGRFERRAKFATWLVSIAGNTGLQRLRDRKQFESLDDDGSDQEEFRPKQVRAWGDDPEEMYSKTQQRDLLERAISRLPAKYRVVLLLRDVQQLSTEDAAAALALSVPALKARLLRGRLMLRENLAPHFSAEAQSA